MQKTTIYLDEDAYRELKQLAKSRGQTPASMVREAVVEYTARHSSRQRPRSIGAARSGRTDLSERAEALLSGMGRDE